MTPVSNAVDTIRDNLKDGFFDGVTPGELRENTRVLESLTPEQTNDAVAELTDDQLDKWTDEIYDGKTLGIIGGGGLSADERTDLYNNLARDLEPAQLERFYNALGDQGRQDEFIDAIAAHASDDTKTEFIALLADNTTDNPSDFDAGFLSSTSTQWDQDARAVSTLIGSIDSPNAIDAAIGSLDNEQLEAVLHAGIEQTSTTFLGSGGHPVRGFDTEGLTNLLDAVGNSRDPAVKARVFELGARQIDTIRETDTLFSPNPSAGDHSGEVAAALSRLLQSDTVGIITALEKGDGIISSRTGNGLSVFSEELVRQGDTTTLQEIIGYLQAGNDLNADPVEFLSRSTTDQFGNRDFQNASNLGFFIGSIREGIGAINADNQAQADTLRAIFGTALGLGGLAVPGSQVIGKAAIVVGSQLNAPLVNGITNDLANGNLALGDALEQLALPPEVFSSDVTGPFGDAIDSVVRN